MKNLGITQRVEVIQSYNERRDCLDQRWSLFANELGFNLIPLANIKPQLVENYIKDLNIDAIILSGGNSITQFSPDAEDVAIERDGFESMLIKQAIVEEIPLIGVCRGLQFLNIYLGGNLSPITGHVGLKHEILSSQSRYKFPQSINSYHNWSIAHNDLAGDLEVLATDSARNIEAACHKNHKLLGIMWHPERESPFDPLDIKLFKEFLT